MVNMVCVCKFFSWLIHSEEAASFSQYCFHTSQGFPWMSSIIDRNYDLLIRFTLICLPQNENELRVWDVVYSEDPEETAKPS